MNKTKFTPGPWHWEDGFLGNLLDANGDRVTGSLANNSLIAAAPDMYEALQDIVEQAELAVQAIPADLADSIRIFGKAALRKARGEDEAPIPVEIPNSDGDPDEVPA